MSSGRRRVVWAASLIALGLTLEIACGGTRANVVEIIRATTPHGVAVPDVSGPTRTGPSPQYIWGFETPMQLDDYVDWLVSPRGAGLEVVKRDEHLVWMSKLVEGDVYRIAVAVEPFNGGTRVHVTLTVSPG